MAITQISSHKSMIGFTLTDKSAQFLDELVDKIVPSEFRKAGNRRKKAAKAVAPVRTGRYRDGIDTEIKKEDRSISLEFGGKAWHTHLVEYGTRRMRPRPIIKKHFEGIDDEIGAGISARANKIRDLC